MPRTGKVADGQARKNLVRHLPRWLYQRIRVPSRTTRRRRPFWGSTKRVPLRHLGDVTRVLRTCRRHEGPQQTTICVTHRPVTVTAREIVGVSLRRWGVEVLHRARKGGVGWGQQQVTKQVDRVERSIAVALMASLLLLRLRARDIPADRPWSALGLHRAWAWEGMQAQCARAARQMARSWLQMGTAA